jgi:hypothetical protein
MPSAPTTSSCLGGRFRPSASTGIATTETSVPPVGTVETNPVTTARAATRTALARPRRMAAFSRETIPDVAPSDTKPLWRRRVAPLLSTAREGTDRMAGIIDQIQLFAVLLFAIPVAMFGADQLLSGNTDIGLAMIGIAILMVVLEEYVIKPSDVAADAAKSAAGRVVESDGDEVETVESEVVDDDAAAEQK